jgi:hypothetical protein
MKRQLIGLKDTSNKKNILKGEVYMEKFALKHENGKLIVFVSVEGKLYEMDVTEYFEKDNAHDEWLDFRLNLK